MLTHKGTVIIKTERLCLRPFRITDAKNMFERWAYDGRVTRWLTWQPHSSAQETERLLSIWCNEYEKLDYYNWVMETDEGIIGNISVVDVKEKDECAALGYCIGFDYWGKGYTSEALKAVAEYLFGEIGFNRLEISHAAQNPASGKVAQKCGFAYEGTRRESYKHINGEFLDLLDYAQLKREWLKNKER